jgi:hypothetical protein
MTLRLSLDFCRNLQKGTPFYRFLQIFVEICREVCLSAKSAERCTPSADFCRNLRFLQKGVHFLQKF